MAKLYFKYGAMGSSKSAQALITKFNYEELGMTVWLIKPSVDTRDGADIVRSRIGLECRAQIITPEQNILDEYRAVGRHDNAFTRIIAWPGKQLQHLTTNEPDDGMMECAIESLKLVLPDTEGEDRW